MALYAGDIVPTSPLGRAFAVFFMYLGIVLLALPISVVGTSFQREYERLYPQNDVCGVDDEGNIELGSMGISNSQIQTRRSEREEIKRSLAELHDKVALLMEMMEQLQKNGVLNRQNGFGFNGSAY